MLNTDPLYGIRDMLEYLDGVASSEGRMVDARAGLAFLERAGFRVIHRVSPPVLQSVSPEDLRAVRKALRLTNQRLADEAGTSINAVIRSQSPGSLVRKPTVEAIVSALVRLGATLPE